MNLKNLLFIALLSLVTIPVFAQAPALNVPAWFTHDVARKAQWLPANIKQLGLAAAYQRRFANLPSDVQSILVQMQIPAWQIALIPTDASIQDEILKQFRFMATLAGDPGQSQLGARAEQLLIFGGSAELPTPGDATTGASLGAEGCTAAMSKYILAELK